MDIDLIVVDDQIVSVVEDTQQYLDELFSELNDIITLTENLQPYLGIDNEVDEAVTAAEDIQTYMGINITPVDVISILEMLTDYEDTLYVPMVQNIPITEKVYVDIISVDPASSPVILSQLVTGTGTLVIPGVVNGRPVDRHSIKIRGVSGTGHSINFNLASVTPALLVETGDKFEFKCMGRIFSALVITIGGVGSIKVDVFRW